MSPAAALYDSGKTTNLRGGCERGTHSEPADQPYSKSGTLKMGGKKTRGQVETEIIAAIIRFEKEFMGRGPTETKTYLIDELVLVRLRGIMTPAEQQLVQAENTSRGRELIKQVRHELLERGLPGTGGGHPGHPATEDGQPAHRSEHDHGRAGDHLYVGRPSRVRSRDLTGLPIMAAGSAMPRRRGGWPSRITRTVLRRLCSTWPFRKKSRPYRCCLRPD